MNYYMPRCTLYRILFCIRSYHFRVLYASAWLTGKDFGVEQPARFGVLKEVRKRKCEREMSNIVRAMNVHQHLKEVGLGKVIS